VAIIRSGPARKPQPHLATLLRSRGKIWVDYDGWKRIEEAGRAGANDDRCRLKLLKAEEMLQSANEPEL